MVVDRDSSTDLVQGRVTSDPGSPDSLNLMVFSYIPEEHGTGVDPDAPTDTSDACFPTMRSLVRRRGIVLRASRLHSILMSTEGWVCFTALLYSADRYRHHL